MILFCQVFLIQLLSGLCGGFDWFGYSAYTTTRKPRTPKPYRPVVYENPAGEIFGHQPYQRVYTVAQPYQSFFHQAYTTVKPEPTTENPQTTTMKPKLTTKKPQPDVADQVSLYARSAAYTRQPVVATYTRPTTRSSSSYEVTARPTLYTRPPVSITTTTRSTTSRGSYEPTTRPPPAYRRQHVTVTTTRPTTSRGSYEVTTRPDASQYEPVGSLIHMMNRAFDSKTDQYPPFCHTEEKVEFLEQCEPYKEETCNTRNKEKCSSQVLNDCRPVLKTRVEKVCQNVTNEVCTLVESEEKVRLEEVIFVSSCSVVMEQVCDKRYKLEVTDQEQEVCVDMETVDCTEETITVTDTECVEGTEFYCQQDLYTRKSDCKKISKENCTSTPRRVTVSTCQSTRTLCLNLTSQQAVPIVTKVCRDEPTTVCRVVEDVKPMARKVYTYSMSCDMKEKEECTLAKKVKLESSCKEKKIPVCEHHLGEEECTEMDKEFCHQVEKVVEVEVCDDEFQTYEI